MERLTYRPKEPYISKLSGDLIEAYSDADIRDIINRLAAYEDTRLTPEQCENAKVIIESAFSDDTSKAERIRELLKADKDGRLVVLPCKVGDTVYLIVTKRARVYMPEFRFIKKSKLTFLNMERILQDFGKTVFLTREEAEKALEAMEDD